MMVALLDKIHLSTVIYTVLSCAVVYFVIKLVMKRLRYRPLPGPRGLPLLGNLIPLTHMTLWDHADIYGEVSGFQVLGSTIVVLNTIDSIRDALQSPRTAEVFSARYPSFFKGTIMYPDVILRSIGERHWKQQRQVLHTALKVYGEGIAEIERVVTQEIQQVTQMLSARIDTELDLEDYLGPSILNIIYTLLNGERYEYDDPRITVVIKSNDAANYLANPLIDTLLKTLPFLRFLPFSIGKIYQFVKRSAAVFLDAGFEKCLRAEDRESRKGVSYELLRQSDKLDWFSHDLVKGSIQDVGGAGILTTKYTLLSFFLIMIHHPELQEKIQEEIDYVIGRDRDPCFADRKDMPYTMATILELTRYASNLALCVPHACSQDTDFRGVTIPRDAVIIPNLFRVHHDSALWRDPWLFDPTRFLDDSGHLLPANHPTRQNLIPFGVGKRVCMGETFAKSRIFLYITSLLQRFTFSASGHVPSCDPRTYETDLVIHPPSYNVRVHNRPTPSA